MSDRVNLVTIVGLVDGWAGTDFLVMPDGAVGTLTQLFVSVTDAPSGGTVALSLRNATAGGGDGIDATIADGATTASATGSVLLTGVEATYLRVSSASGSAMNLSGWFLFDGIAPAISTLTSLARVKAEAGIAVSTHDAVLNNLIAGRSVAMQQWMRRNIIQATATNERVDSIGDHRLTLHHYPVISVTSVSENGTALVEDTDFEAGERELAAGQLIRIDGSTDPRPKDWAAGRRIVTVTYVHGYASVPADLVDAATAQVRHDFHQTQPSDQNRLGMEQKVLPTGGTSIYTPGGWLPQTLQAMTPYRRVA